MFQKQNICPLDCRKSLCLAKRLHLLRLTLLILGRKTTLLSFHSGAAAPQSRLKCVTDTFIYAVTPTRAESISASQKRLGRCPKPHKCGVLKGQSPFVRVSRSETMDCVRVWLTQQGSATYIQSFCRNKVFLHTKGLMFQKQNICPFLF